MKYDIELPSYSGFVALVNLLISVVNGPILKPFGVVIVSTGRFGLVFTLNIAWQVVKLSTNPALCFARSWRFELRQGYSGKKRYLLPRSKSASLALLLN